MKKADRDGDNGRNYRPDIGNVFQNSSDERQNQRIRRADKEKPDIIKHENDEHKKNLPLKPATHFELDPVNQSRSVIAMFLRHQRGKKFLDSFFLNRHIESNRKNDHKSKNSPDERHRSAKQA